MAPSSERRQCHRGKAPLARGGGRSRSGLTLLRADRKIGVGDAIDEVGRVGCMQRRSGMSETGRTERRGMPSGSLGWQPSAIAENMAGTGAYLEFVATTPELLEVARRTLESLALAFGQRVLEVGCGTGVFLPLLAAAVGIDGNVVGVDHSPDFVAQARERVAALGIAETVEVREGSAYQL